MKKLILMRHAKSSWDDPRLTDFERPLNERGLRAAPLMGRHMKRRKIAPGLILSSPAERARRTAALVAEAAGITTAPIRYDERIYEASAARLLEVVSQIEDGVDEAMLVGHNPGMAELLALLTGESRPMPTAAIARIALDVEKWSKARIDSGTLELHIRPKDLEDED